MRLANFSAVVFDLDGTLIDSRASILQGFAHALTSQGMQARTALSDVRIGPPLKEILSQLSGTHDEARLQALADDFVEHYDRHGYRATEAYVGVRALLEKLRAHTTPCFIATNKRIVPTRLIIDLLKWDSFFVDVYALDRSLPPLPDKTAMLAHLLAEQSLSAKTTLYVGDTRGDELAAHANSMPFAAATWGYGDFLATQESAFATPQALMDHLTQ